MKAMQRSTLAMVLAVSLTLPATALLAGAPAATDEHATHHADAAPAVAAPAAAAAPIDMQAMRNRMREIHQTADPDKRKALIEAQLKDMETMLRDPNRNCPMVDGKAGMMSGKGGMGMGEKCGKGMMSGKGGMGMDGKCGKGMMGQGMPGGMGMAGQDDMMAKRMDMMEKRMDMMQMMMQMRMQGMGGGMGPGMQGGMGMPTN